MKEAVISPSRSACPELASGGIMGEEVVAVSPAVVACGNPAKGGSGGLRGVEKQTKPIIVLKHTLILLLAFTTTLCHAQHYHLRNFTPQNGLGSSSVNHIFQDAKGFVWFANQMGGITRFDGSNLITLTTADGLINNDATYIANDRKGNLWIGTAAGVSVFNGSAFRNPAITDKTVYCIHASRQNTLWFATLGDGVIALDESGKKTAFTTANGLAHNSVFTITETADGALWFGHRKGIAVLRKGIITDFSNRFPEPDGNIFFCSFADQNGEVWFGSESGKVVIAKPGDVFVDFKLPAPFNKSFISGITRDQSGNLWFATANGLLKFDGTNFKIFNQQNGLSTDAVQAVMCDYENNIWVGTLTGGANLLSSEAFVRFGSKEGLTNKTVIQVNADGKTGRQFIATAEGLFIFSSNKIARASLPQELQAAYISAVSVDANGQLWLCVGDEVLMLGEQQQHFNIKKRWNTAGETEIISPQHILHDNLGNTWVATFGSGLLKFSGGQAQAFLSKNSSLPDDLLVIHLDAQGALWISTADARLFRLAQNTFSEVGLKELSNAQTWSMATSANVSLFLGTANAGVAVVQNGKVHFINAASGLNSNYITSLLWEEKTKTLWAGSEKGLNKIELNEKHEPKNIIAYTEREGFNAASVNSISKDNSGSLLLATVDGLWVLNPLLDKTKNYPAKLHLSSIRLFYEAVDWQRFSKAIDTSTQLPQSLSLPHRQNHLTFDMQALTTANARYTFILEGQDEKWSTSAFNKAITYTNLAPGSYIFKAKAITGINTFSENEISFAFTILPPWWSTWWFRLLVAATVFGALIFYIKWREHSLRQSNIRLEKTVQERTHELELTLAQKEVLLKQKMMLMKEVHHRVKNNLQSISSLLTLQGASLKDEAAKVAITETQNRVRSIALLHQRLYKTDDIETVDFKAFTEDLVKQLGNVFNSGQNKVNIKLNIPEISLLTDIAIPLGLMLNELLTNSFKYAFEDVEQPEISIELIKKEPNNIVIHYADNGKGIQKPNPLESPETLGLRLVNLLALQINAKVTYTSKPSSEFLIEFSSKR